MTKVSKIRRASLGTALAAALAAGLAAAAPSPALAQTAAPVAPANDVTLSVGTGRMVRLTGAGRRASSSPTRRSPTSMSARPARSTSSARRRQHHRLRHRPRPAGSSIRRTSGSARTSASVIADARPGDARGRHHRHADERHGPPDRHRRPARRRGGGRAAGPGLRRRRRRRWSAACARRRRSRSICRSGSPRSAARWPATSAPTF